MHTTAEAEDGGVGGDLGAAAGGGRRRRRALLALSLALSVGASACHLPDWRGPVGGPRVAAVGDSLLHQLQHSGPTHPDSNVALTLSLIDEGWRASVRGENGWMTQWVRSLAVEAAEQGAEGIIIVAGTNDVSWVSEQPDRAAARDYVHRQIVATLDDVDEVRCVVWPTIANPGGRHAVSTVNGTLRREDAARTNLRVPEWGRLLADHPEWLGSNGLHLSEAGEAASQDVLFRAMRRCLGSASSGPTSVPPTPDTPTVPPSTTVPPPTTGVPPSTTVPPTTTVPTTVPTTTVPPTVPPSYEG